MRAASAVFLAVLCVVSDTRANDSSMHEGAYGPEPRGALKGDESIVRMESESISLRFEREKSEVAARFVFRSAKADAAARQLVGFPDFGAARKEGERRDPKGVASWHREDGDNSGPLENLHTFVDGKEVESTLEYGFIIDDEAVGWKPGTPETGTLMAWHTVWVTFPPGREVVVERRYRLNNGSVVGGISTFHYTTATGAAWRGTIGRLTADVTLDGWTVNDLAWRKHPKTQSYADGPFTAPDKKAWKIVSPTRLQLDWKDFEPRTDKDRRGFNLVTRGKKIPAE